jgi:aminopeptidase N
MRRCPGLVFAVLVLVGTVRGQAPPEAPLRTAGDRPIDIRHMRLDLRVDLPRQTVDARSSLQVRGMRPLSSVSLDAVEFEVKAVRIAEGDGEERPAHFSHDGRKLVIDLDPAWPAGHDATFHIDYRVREPRDGLHFFAPTPAEPDVPLTVWSQGEAVTNRYWFPCLDQPDQRQTTDLVVTVAEGFEVLSNGKLVERRANPADKTVTFHWRQDKPHVSYLVTLVVGKFEVVRQEWNGLPVLYYVPKDRKDEVEPTFGRTPRMLEYFSRRFGDYPWDKYAQVVVEQFNEGGMENTSATTLHEFILHDRRSLLDGSADGIVAHELAHQWWGDLLTCRDWAHLWLNEGFASYAEALWAEYDKGADEYAYVMYEKAREAIAGGKDRPIVDRRYLSPNDMFDARAYPKGAFVLHMLRRRLGEDAFWKGMRRYAKEHRLQSVETSDFRRSLEAESGRDLDRFFYDWTERPGSPVLEVNTEYQSEGRLAKVAIKQTQGGETFHFPLRLVFHCEGSGGTKEVVQEQDMTTREQTLYVPLQGRPTRVEVDPNQEVLADIKEDKGHDLWAAQLRQSHSVAARVRAARHFAEERSPEDREALAKALPEEKFWGVQVEIAGALGDAGGDVCRDALLAGLKQKDARVRRACAQHLGKFYRDTAVAAALKRLLREGDESWGVEAAALGAYARLGESDAVALLLPWLAKPSHNDVLRQAALGGLGEAHDLAALDPLLGWTKRGKPRECRTAALRALGRLALTAGPSDAQRQQIVAAAGACLEGESRPVRGTAVDVLRDLGRSAAPTLTALEALSRHDPEDGIRQQARKAIEQVRSNQPVPVELTRLREELDRLRESQEKLQDRLNKFEKVEHKGR